MAVRSSPGCDRPVKTRGAVRDERWRKSQPAAYRQRSANDVEATRKARADGMILTDIAEKFGCSESTVERAVKGKTFGALASPHMPPAGVEF